MRVFRPNKEIIILMLKDTDYITNLDLSLCKKLTLLPEELPNNLQKLNLCGCEKLTSLPNLPNGLKELDLSLCKELTLLPEELPNNLQKLNLCGCEKLTSLPNLPNGLKELNLYGCIGLPNTLAIVAQLMELETKNRNNHDFQLIWPKHIDSTLLAKKILSNAYKSYHESNPDLKDLNLEPNPSDRANFPTFALFHRFMNESTAQRGGVNQIARSIFPTIEAIRKNPQILEFIDESSKAYLDACVNQPVAGVTEIANLVAITTKIDIPSKLEAAKTLMAINLIKEEVTKLGVCKRVEIELGNAMLREVHNKLLKDKAILRLRPWQGIPEGIAYETTIRSFLTPNNIDKISTEVSDFLKDTSKEKVADYLCEGPLQNFWATQTLSKEEIKNLEQPLTELKGQFLNLEDQTEEVEEAAIILEKIRLAETEYKKSILIESRNKTFDAIRRPKTNLLTLCCSINSFQKLGINPANSVKDSKKFYEI